MHLGSPGPPLAREDAYSSQSRRGGRSSNLVPLPINHNPGQTKSLPVPHSPACEHCMKNKWKKRGRRKGEKAILFLPLGVGGEGLAKYKETSMCLGTSYPSKRRPFQGRPTYPHSLHLVVPALVSKFRHQIKARSRESRSRPWIPAEMSVEAGKLGTPQESS